MKVIERNQRELSENQNGKPIWMSSSYQSICFDSAIEMRWIGSTHICVMTLVVMLIFSEIVIHIKCAPIMLILDVDVCKKLKYNIQIQHDMIMRFNSHSY